MEHALKDLRGHIVPSSCHFELPLGLLASHCGPKIDDLDAVVALLAFRRTLPLEIHDVVELDIAVHDALLVQVGQRCQQLLGNPHHQRLRKLPQLFDQLNDRSTPAVLHHHIVERSVVVDLV